MYRFGLLLGFSIICWIRPLEAATPVVEWSIVAHKKVVDNGLISDTRMDLLALDASSRTQLYDYRCAGYPVPEEIPCATAFKRKGSIESFGNIGDGFEIISNGPRLNALMLAHPGKIIVVDQLNFCTEPDDTIIGCADFLLNTFVIEKDAEADIFLHEFGHIRGLEHRNTCDRTIMNEYTMINDAWNAEECIAIGGKPFTAISATGSSIPLSSLNEPFWANTNIVVPSGQTLVIEPNVNIQFNKGISIRGRVTADGRAGPIRLYSNCSGEHPCPRNYPVIP